jgi:hypothetical protein
MVWHAFLDFEQLKHKNGEVSLLLRFHPNYSIVRRSIQLPDDGKVIE